MFCLKAMFYCLVGFPGRNLFSCFLHRLIIFKCVMCFNRQFYLCTGEWIWSRWPGLWRLCAGLHGRWANTMSPTQRMNVCVTGTIIMVISFIWGDGPTESTCLPLSDSPTTLESSLSPAELVPFQGCVIPPLTPQPEFSPEESLINPFTQAANPPAQDGALWRDIAQCHGRALEQSVEVNNQVNERFLTCVQCGNLELMTVVHRVCIDNIFDLLELYKTCSSPADGYSLFFQLCVTSLYKFGRFFYLPQVTFEISAYSYSL